MHVGVQAMSVDQHTEGRQVDCTVISLGLNRDPMPNDMFGKPHHAERLVPDNSSCALGPWTIRVRKQVVPAADYRSLSDSEVKVRFVIVAVKV